MGSLIKPVVLAVMLLAYAAVSAQTFQASYRYDANGNRERAVVIYLSELKSTSTPKVEDEINLEKQAVQVSIYPNPTRGDLRVDITGATPELFDNIGNAIKVWDMQGRLLLSLSPVVTSNEVDLSTQRNGTYIMQLFFGGKVTDYKIVKE